MHSKTHSIQTCMHTHSDQKPQGLLFCKIQLSFYTSSSFCIWYSFLALITVVDIAKLPTVPGNCWTEPHNRDFDLLFNHLRCEYTLWSANESVCCSTRIPYLDITALIRWSKLISKSEHRCRCFADCQDRRGVSLMMRLPSSQLDCLLTVISPANLVTLSLSFVIWCSNKANPIGYSLCENVLWCIINVLGGERCSPMIVVAMWGILKRKCS